MVKLTFVSPDGTRTVVDATSGQSVMEAATSNGIDGIVAECGGSMACATCHVFVDATTAARLDGPAADEDDMLDFAATDRRPTSRLSCQIMVGDTLDGAEFTLPEEQ